MRAFLAAARLRLLAAGPRRLAIATVRPAPARDLGQWKEVDPQISSWFARLIQPDTIGMGGPGVSCCGEADAYWADITHVRDGHLIAAITDDRDDAPLEREHEEIGTEYPVPPGKNRRHGTASHRSHRHLTRRRDTQ